MPDDRVTTESQLRETYKEPAGNSVKKELDHLDKHCRAFLELSPFCVLATADPDGKIDASPRGDHPGFAEAPDEHTVMLPDRPGNNRLDSLGNVVEHPEVGLLFMVPGFNETLRVNGTAEVLREPALCERFAVDGKPARSVLRVHVREVFFHCAKAFLRSRLWDADAQQDRKSFPTFGTILSDQTKGGEPAEIDAFIEERKKTHMW